MRTIEREGLVEHAAEVGDYLAESLSALARARRADRGRARPGPDARDRAERATSRRDVAAAALDEGLIVNAIGERTLRLVPPLVITRDEVDEAVLRLEQRVRCRRPAAGTDDA